MSSGQTGTTAPTNARFEAVLVSVALAASNAASYLLNVVAARVLAPAAFGELSSLLALLVIGVVPAMGLQTVVALQVARWKVRAVDPTRAAPLLGLGLTTTAGVVVIGAVATAPLVWLLHLDGPASALWLTVALAPLTLLGLFHGILQGARRFGVLAALVLLEGVGKVGGSLLGLLLTEAASGALAGAALGSCGVVAVGWWWCGRPLPAMVGFGQVREVLHAVQAMLALVLLLNLDLVLARSVLPAPQAGEYAVGSIIAKIAYWLPQAVAVVVLPRLADAGSRRRALPLAMLTCAGLGGSVLAVCVLFGSGLLVTIGGADYAGSTMPAWPFALAGALWAWVQLLLYARLADQDRRVTLLLWLAVLAEVGLVVGWWNGSASEVVSAAIVVGSVLAVLGAAVEAYQRRMVR